MASIQNLFIRLFLRVATKKNDVVTHPVEVTRQRLAKLMGMVKPPKQVKFEKADCNGVPGEWNIPDQVNTNGVILYIHGGIYVACSIDTHRPLVARIAKAAKTKALSIQYRLAPEHPFPAAIEDTVKAYCWLLEQGYSSSEIIIAGDSAGGGLTLATILKLRDSSLPLPAAAVCMSPWLDLTCSHDSGKRLDKIDLMLSVSGGLHLGGLYIGKDSATNPYISPYYANLQGLPPLLIHVSDSEIILDENVGFAKKAEAAGVKIQFEVWKKMNHVWHGYAPILPEANRAITKIGQYIQNAIGNK